MCTVRFMEKEEMAYRVNKIGNGENAGEVLEKGERLNEKMIS